MSQINGSCLCGKVKYSVPSEPLFMANCHCKSCQKSSGAMFAPIVGVPEAQFSVDGDLLSSYASLGDSGKPIHRFFCSQCGTVLFGKGESQPGVVYLRAGSIDGDFEFVPSANVYWRDHQDWLPADIPCFDTMPPTE